MNLNCTWREMMREAAQRLAAAGVENAPHDARLLLAHALSIEPLDVIVREMDAVDATGLTEFEAAISRRLRGEPVSRIRGWREFYGRRFKVTPDVLDPRPETELLVEEGIGRLPPRGRVLDLGTGSGCILVSVLAECPRANGVGVDISAAALEVARENAASLGVADRVSFIEGSWNAAQGPFDLVLSNPPYVAEAEFEPLPKDVRNYDPRIALVGEGGGLDPYHLILAQVDRLLAPGGSIGFEFGASQGEAVAGLMDNAGLIDIELLEDLAGLSRAAFGRRPGVPA
jgi:release factor glutamine methyltransferase